MILQPGAQLRVTTSGSAPVSVSVSADVHGTRMRPCGHQVAISSATTTTIPICGTNLHATVRSILARNNHATDANTVSIVIWSGSAAFTVMSAILFAGETLTYSQDAGFAVLSASGLPKSAQSLGAQPAAVNTFNIVTLASQVVNSNATANTLQDVTGMAFPVVAGETYWFEATILFRAALATTGARFTVNGPSFSELAVWSQVALTATTMGLSNVAAYSQPAAAFVSSAATTGNIALIGGIVRATAPGSIQLQVASEISNSAITVVPGSILRWVRTL
jgi:hypothetical protein